MSASILAAAYYKRKITETLPVTVLLSIVMFFLLGLTGRISHIVGAYILCVAFADAVFVILLYKKHISKKRIAAVFDPGIVIWAVLVALLIPLYSHVRVFNWDDFHYWAIYPRNMFEINGAPNGAFACTGYKDYMRGIQFVYFFIFRIIGRFSEPAMFVANNALIVTAMMPFFEKRTEKPGRWLPGAAIGILLPYLTMFQMLHCLGVDCIMTVFFGYGMWAVYDEKKDLFRYVRMIAVMAALTVTKTAGLVFATVIFVIFLIKEEKKIIPILSYSVPAGLFAIWKVYCIKKGNTTYLHDIVEENLTGGRSHMFPTYTKSVTADFVRNFFAFRLNGGFLGATPVVILCICIAVYFAYKEKKKQDRYVFAAVLTGMVLYLLSVLYTYLFVFVEWEAISLSSYDRYVSNYMGALLYVAAIIVIKKNLLGEKMMIAVIALCMLTLNYGMIRTQLSPSAFASEYADEAKAKEDMEEEMQNLRSFGIPQGEYVLVVLPYDADDVKLYAEYSAVPLNVGFFDASSDGADQNTLIRAASNENMSYVYLTKGAATGALSSLMEGRPYMIENGVLCE